MPIYEYESLEPEKGCPKCTEPFEVIQDISDPPIAFCPSCGGRVCKVISRCRAIIMETPAENSRVENKIKGYEREGMWSHAAELADKHSEKTSDREMKLRALDNYKKAGYNADSLDKHLGKED